jgi:Flp pilus assembly protein TadG
VQNLLAGTRKFAFEWRRFLRARDGNIALTFALALFPILSMVGAAVDFSQANAMKTNLQGALDSTALMVSTMATSVGSAQLQTSAQTYFAALFTAPGASNIKITATYSAVGGSSVTVSGSGEMSTEFMSLIGFNKLTVNGTSTVKWGSSRLRVALVLDNTGSMASDGKITALKTASKNLLTQLKSAATQNGDVYVSIIPFSKDVNVGASNYNANWIEWSDWDANNGADSKVQVCTPSVGKNGKVTTKCANSTTWVPNHHNTWNGCLTDRDMNYDQLATAPNPADASLPAGQASTLFPAEQYGSCPLQMMGLNYNWASMNSLIDQMYPNGNTNQPIGLVWGWQSLIGGGPLTAPAMDSNSKYQQVIILLSDGLNTENRYYTQQSQIDNRMVQSGSGLGTCANIKAAGIIIYTIQVNTGGDATSTLLQNCASGLDKFFLLTSANQMVTTFNTIGTNLTKLRIAQ